MSDSHSVVPPEVEEMARQAAVSPTSHDWMYVWGAGLLVGIAAVAWVYYRRTHPRHHHHHHHHPEEPAGETSPETTGPSRQAKQTSHHRHSRRRRWGRRNPTLAQTGGLPPVREEAPPASPQPNSQ